jgi:hypothetical protein
MMLLLAFIQAATATSLMVDHSLSTPTQEQAAYVTNVALGSVPHPTDSTVIGQLYESLLHVKHLAEPVDPRWIWFCAFFAGASLLLLIAKWQTRQEIATLVDKS